MTEETNTTTATEERRCRMGSRLPKPCPFPATVSLPEQFGDDEPRFCEFHAALVPLNDELDDLNICLSLTQTCLKAVRRQPSAQELQRVLERAEADFRGRVELIRKSIDDLKAAEYALIR